jgi:hypothetical protein
MGKSSHLARVAPCKLCGNTEKLCKSHLLPQSLYRYLRYDENGKFSAKEPFFVSKTRATRTSKQVQDYLLCAQCERRFSAFGEAWVVRQCAVTPLNFPLQKTLLEAPRKHELDTGWIIETGNIANIQAEKLGYFGVSVLWGAAVHHWIVEGRESWVDLSDRYQQQFRAYLLGQSDFPGCLVLMVKVASITLPITQALHFPHGERNEHFWSYRFVIPGIIFDFRVADEIRDEWRQGCIVRGPGHPLFLLNGVELFQPGAWNLLKTAIPSRGLMQEFLPKQRF